MKFYYLVPPVHNILVPVYTSMEVKFHTSILAQDEVYSISDILEILDFVYNASHNKNEKYYQTFMLHHGTFILFNYLQLWIYFRGRGTKFITQHAQHSKNSALWQKSISIVH
jgi:hypothetical protein